MDLKFRILAKIMVVPDFCVIKRGLWMKIKIIIKEEK